MKVIRSRNANKRLTIDIGNIEIEDYIFLSSKISEKFNLIAITKLVHGFDEIFQDFSDKEYIIGLAWDVWSGYTIVAQDIKSEELVNKIYNWLSKEGIPQKVSYIKRLFDF